MHTVGSGRTDAGAHASGQVVAFSTESVLPAKTLRRAVNAHLPFDIVVTSASDAPAAFHPRFDALSRTYRYLIWNREVRSPFYHDRATHVRTPLDESRIDQALRVLVGWHDVSAFVPVRHDGGRERFIFRAGCRREGDLVIIELEASGFLRQMVRAIVGTVIHVGAGRLDARGFQDILESRRREMAGDTAPAQGLYLMAVTYPMDVSSDTVPGQAVLPAEYVPLSHYEEKQ